MTEDELNEIEHRLNQATQGPWKAYIEDRDHESGSSFIMTGPENQRGEDIGLYGATIADYDFIANARQDIPRLLKAIRELKAK
ncbi:hypothetical protein FW778_22265 [Ginsengibacter hankyongi]|uniref:Uncharacterized protein n=1 Tax=Ginsengibacter hankyongi TaxID=2607284 RepID=A0A5J5I9Y1_9BACT|nr:hypothetical protein [Ginsengibacter hankyongi]KAA9034564.1 hypothetical protein FW778_22265 [Ginsengibacter hankyongi]